MAPSEFWGLTPTEFWWHVERRADSQTFSNGMSRREVREIYEQAYGKYNSEK